MSVRMVYLLVYFTQFEDVASSESGVSVLYEVWYQQGVECSKLRMGTSLK
jgi:hypothetical protein